MTHLMARLTTRLISVLLIMVGVLALSGCDEDKLLEGCRFGTVSDLEPGQPSLNAPHSPQPAGKDLVLDPESLRTALFDGNTTVLLELNRVHRAKDQVNLARANLLPSINLGTLLGATTNPGFMLSSVEMLLPFLIPSKWFDYFSVKDLFEAEKIAFRLAKLNVYASAYALYLTANADIALSKMLGDELGDLSEIEIIVDHAFKVGLETRENLERARGQRAMAAINLSKVDDLLAREQASIRHALGIGAEAAIKLKEVEMAQSEWEERTLAESLAAAMGKAPEVEQVGFLLSAAKNGTWSKVFGFISGTDVRASQGSGGGGGGGGAFSNITVGSGFNLGFYHFPLIELSHRNEDELKLRKNEIKFEITETLEIAMRVLDDAKDRLTLAEHAESSFRHVYDTKFAQFRIGAAPLGQVINARMLLRQGGLEVLRANTQLALSRITLHRLMLTDQFEKIEGCKVVNGAKGPTSSVSPFENPPIATI